MEVDSNDDAFAAQRLRARRWTSRMVSLFVSSRAVSSSVFVILVVLTDHIVAGADDYVTSRMEGDYDPIAMVFLENVYMIIMCGLLYGILSLFRTVRPTNEWMNTGNITLAMVLGAVLGVQGTLWAISAADVKQSSFEGAAVVQVPLVFFVQYVFFEDWHPFHLIGALYSCSGLIAETIGGNAVGGLGAKDVVAVGNHAAWSVLLVGLAYFFSVHKRIPVITLTLWMSLMRLVVVTVVLLTCIMLKYVKWEAFACILYGMGCERTIPAILVVHAAALTLRLLSFVIVVKYIGAPLCAVTGVTSNCLRFYTHSKFSTLDLGAACASIVGCAVFTQGQWLYEVAANEAWDAAMRHATIAALFSSDDDCDDDDGLDEGSEYGPLVRVR